MNFTVSDREFATILFSLRRYQEDYRTDAKNGFLYQLEELDHFHDHKPLTDKEVDKLCERINVVETKGKSTKAEMRQAVKDAIVRLEAILSEDGARLNRKVKGKILSTANRLSIVSK